jgi:type I restriction enzyme M protein
MNLFDVVISNPPWGLNNARANYAVFESAFGTPPRNNADYAYILHMISRMKEVTGRMAVIVSSGALFRSGAEAAIRHRLCEANLVDAVIGLPERLFENTSVAASIVVLRRDRKTEEPILFIDARGMSRTIRRGNFLPPEAILAIAETYGSRRETTGMSRSVPNSELCANEYSLHVPRYVHPVEYEDTTTLAEIVSQRKQLEQELREIGSQLDEELERLGLRAKGF